VSVYEFSHNGLITAAKSLGCESGGRREYFISNGGHLRLGGRHYSFSPSNATHLVMQHT